jgi:hypothetical protein
MLDLVGQGCGAAIPSLRAGIRAIFHAHALFLSFLQLAASSLPIPTLLWRFAALKYAGLQLQVDVSCCWLHSN